MKKYRIVVVISICIILGVLSACSSSKMSESEATTTEKMATSAAIEIPQNTDYEALGNEYGSKLQMLFLDYLQLEKENLKFIKSGKVVEKDTNGLISLYKVTDDEIRCYEDLKAIFMEVCTSEYSDFLLQDTSVKYENLMEVYLYFTTTTHCFRGVQDAYVKDWKINENNIVYTILLEGDDYENDNYPEQYDPNYVHKDDYDTTFTMTLTYDGEKWRISDCENPIGLGYCFNHRIIEQRKNGQIE